MEEGFVLASTVLVPLRVRVLQQIQDKPLPVSAISVDNEEEAKALPALLENLVAEGQLRFHEFKHPTSPDTSLIIYFKPFPQQKDLEIQPKIAEAKAEEDTAPPPLEPPTTPSTPPKANHLNRPMSAALKSRLGKRRPSNFISPLSDKSPAKNAEEAEKAEGQKEDPDKEKETPVKRRRLLHSPRSKDQPQTAASPSKMTPEEEKSWLLAQIKKKQELLEELKRKRYLAEQKFSNKEEQEKVKQLIAKWRTACQEVIVELHNNALERTPEITIPQLLEFLHIEPQTVGYSDKEERFL